MTAGGTGYVSNLSARTDGARQAGSAQSHHAATTPDAIRLTTHDSRLATMDPHTYYQTAFSRNTGLFTEAEQDLLRRSRVAVAGLSGHLILLTKGQQ